MTGPNSLASHICFWLITAFFIIGLPILAKIYLHSSYQIGGVGGQIGHLYFILWVIVIVVNAFSGTWTKITHGILVSAKTSEYFSVNIGGMIIFTGNGSDWVPFPVLWPFVTKRYPREPIVLTETFMVLTGASKQSKKAMQDEKGLGLDGMNPLDQQANHPITVQTTIQIPNHPAVIFLETNGGGYDNAIPLYLSFEKVALSRVASERTPRQIIDNRKETDNAILEDVLEMTGELARDPNKYIGFDTRKLRLVNPLLAEPINVGLLTRAETLITRFIKLTEGKTEKELEILRKEAEAKGISLVGFSEADVHKAKQIADIVGYPELDKRMGAPAGITKMILDGLPDITKNMDVRTVLLAGGGGDTGGSGGGNTGGGEGNNFLKEIMKMIVAIKSVGDDFLKPKQ